MRERGRGEENGGKRDSRRNYRCERERERERERENFLSFHIFLNVFDKCILNVFL